MEIINMIAELFKLELEFKVQKLTPDQFKVQRERRSKTILSKETYDKRQSAEKQPGDVVWRKTRRLLG